MRMVKTDDTHEGHADLAALAGELATAHGHVARLTQARDGAISQLRAQGVRVMDIADACDLAPARVYQILTREGETHGK